MKNIIFAIIFLVVSAVSYADVGEQEQTQLLPLQNLGFENKELTLSLLLPCNAQFLGLYVDQKIGPVDELRLAAVVKRKVMLCTGLPTLMRQKIKGLKWSGLKKIVKLSATSLEKKIQIATPSDIYQVKTNGDVSFAADIGLRCGTLIGSLWDWTDEKENPKLGFLVTVPKEKHCTFNLATASLPFIDAAQVPTIKRLTVRSSLEQLYDLRIRRVEKVRSANGLISDVVYKRLCQEVPVALVVRDSGVVKVGVLTARFFNKRCDAGTASRLFTDVFALKHYPIALNGRQVQSFRTSTGAFKFRLKEPKAANINKNGLQVSYRQRCEQPVGLAVFNSDAKLAVGVLEPIGKSECNVPSKEVFLKEPMTSHLAADTKVYPLHLDGDYF